MYLRRDLEGLPRLRQKHKVLGRVPGNGLGSPDKLRQQQLATAEGASVPQVKSQAHGTRYDIMLRDDGGDRDVYEVDFKVHVLVECELSWSHAWPVISALCLARIFNLQKEVQKEVSMNSLDEKARRIIEEAMLMPENKRTEFVDAACGSNLSLLASVQEQLSQLSDDAPDLHPTIRLGAATDMEIPAPGDRVCYFGDYEILEEIARGGMGVVFKARQVKLNRTVALKVILSGEWAGPEEIQRFKTEAQAAANLDHPGIVPIFEIGEHNGQHYFSMGLVEGPNLADRVSLEPLPPRKAAEIMEKVSRAVAYAHQKGVIHRDLKPANVLLDTNDEPRVTDFGLAKRIESDRELTRTGIVLGTPNYMPPEQADGRIEAIGPQADVYSLGAILYFLLTGRAPFQSASPLQTLRNVIEKEPLAPREIDENLPSDLETICLKALMKSVDRRYGSAEALAEDLRRFLNSEAILARRPSFLYRAQRFVERNRKLVTIASLAVGMAMLGLIATIGWLNSQLNQARIASQLDRKRAEANRLGGIVLADDTKLHWRRFPAGMNVTKNDHGWRFYVPAGKSYRLMVYMGAFSNQHPMGVANSEDAWQLLTLDASPQMREVVLLISFRRELRALVRGEPEVEVVNWYLGRFDPAGFNGVISTPLPKAMAEVFGKDRRHATRYYTPGEKETMVLTEQPGSKVLVKVTALEHPPEVDAGEITWADWMKKNTDPGRGLILWVEPAPSPADSAWKPPWCWRTRYAQA